MPPYMRLSGSWLTMTESAQRILKRRALEWHHPPTLRRSSTGWKPLGAAETLVRHHASGMVNVPRDGHAVALAGMRSRIGSVYAAARTPPQTSSREIAMCETSDPLGR